MYVFAPSDSLLIVDDPQPAEIYVELEKLSEVLYLDTSLIPQSFDRDTLVRLYNFLGERIIPDCRTPFPEYCDRLPVIVRYVPFDEGGISLKQQKALRVGAMLYLSTALYTLRDVVR